MKKKFCPVHGTNIDCGCPILDRDGRPLKRKTYDSKCFDLAEAFLQDVPHLWTAHRTEELAALIQSTIEGFMTYEDANYEPPSPPGWEGGFADNH